MAPGKRFSDLQRYIVFLVNTLALLSKSPIPFYCRRLILLMFAAFLLETTSAQKIYVNTSNAVYELNCVNGNCQLDKIPDSLQSYPKQDYLQHCRFQ